jgi:hypothetical protein
MTLLQTMVLEKYDAPVSGKTYYLYRNFSGTLFVSAARMWCCEKVGSYVWVSG